jgi:hypothetical protein
MLYTPEFAAKIKAILDQYTNEERDQILRKAKDTFGQKTVRTHYDNLKVRRDASIEEMKSAYLTLCSQYESAWLQGDSEAERIRSIIDNAFAVLTDPEKRKDHDEWITREEIMASVYAAIDELKKERDEAASLKHKADKEPPITEGLMTRARKYLRPLLIVFGVVVTMLCLLWGGRYKPIGSAGRLVYVHDRFTGDILVVYGTYKFPVTEIKGAPKPD